MDAITLSGLALALAMDAFAVALSTGVILKRLTGRHLFRLGFHFGLFQALMPIVGWLAGQTVMHYVAAWDHWIAFALLLFVGTVYLGRTFSKFNGFKFDGAAGIHHYCSSLPTDSRLQVRASFLGCTCQLGACCMGGSIGLVVF